jgi:putative lipoic acid-binding regulatory protein
MSSVKGTSPLSCDKKPEIHYPCIWQYKVIGQDQHLIQEAIKEICSPVPVAVTYSHSSSSGKYHSFNAEIEVQDEEARLSIYNALHNHSAIKVVL